jgi:Cu+-exporting ATPase
LQLLKETKVVAVDKTGTLTEGKPILTDLHVLEGFEYNAVLSLMAAVESKSEHPIARAIVQAAIDKELILSPVADFKSVTGYGIEATVSEHLVHIGADRYMEKLGLNPNVFSQFSDRLGEEGKPLSMLRLTRNLLPLLL